MKKTFSFLPYDLSLKRCLGMFGVLGALSGNAITVDDPDCVSVSYPGFWSDLERVTS